MQILLEFPVFAVQWAHLLCSEPTRGARGVKSMLQTPHATALCSKVADDCLAWHCMQRAIMWFLQVAQLSIIISEAQIFRFFFPPFHFTALSPRCCSGNPRPPLALSGSAHLSSGHYKRNFLTCYKDGEFFFFFSLKMGSFTWAKQDHTFPTRDLTQELEHLMKNNRKITQPSLMRQP